MWVVVVFFGCSVSSSVVSSVSVMFVSLLLVGVVLVMIIEIIDVSSGVFVLMSGDMMIVLLKWNV